jgi:hypothetical protein
MRRSVGAAAIVAAAALTGCTGSGSGEPQRASNFVPGAEVPVRLVDCGDWRAADPRERSRTVTALGKFAGGVSGSPGGHGATLETDSAYELFDSYCAKRFARGFKLYKLYTRAAAFGAG